MAKTRNMLLRIWNDFKASFKINLGDLKGEDYMGNKYYELKADPAGGRRYPSRWFQSKNPDHLMQEIPPEWMSWLRRQRSDPPTHEEIIHNLAMAKMKQQNAERKAKEFGKEARNDGSSRTNPRHSECKT